jgi:hypothetical protein
MGRDGIGAGDEHGPGQLGVNEPSAAAVTDDSVPVPSRSVRRTRRLAPNKSG